MEKVILTVGYARSGKSTVAHYLEEKCGYKRIGFSDFIANELAKRNLEITKNNMVSYGEQFRNELGKDYLIKQVLKEAEGNDKVVISGTRLMREYDAIKEKFSNAKMILVSSQEKQRFERRKDQSKTFEEFVARDKEDEKAYGMCEVFAKNDYEIENSGSLEDLLKKVDEIIEKESE
ncbi:MAG: AAA family ATPase [Candidatus Diapherotrites archaeon]|mgnify:CR=1 FL=1|jgi:dephospho-CoA kinase|uniref:AAA family ATPase n=1 Tax=Candidatus Iainarchaeum sp. TaxID=3101447 RepID=A0A8T5GGC8_9ARCH|nr:AAA family ATPase [Candidatus Diapherotrites archaeon]MBT7241149.1 AAA family ATPase [Candidatus Diapherotrites archaeon]